MYRKGVLWLVTAVFALMSLAMIGNVSADPPPPCLTTDLCFEEAIKATNFTGASSLAVGGINLGGELDFVTTGPSRDRIRLKTGNGDGTFTGTWTRNMGNGTTEVDIADFNDDGYTDIIATNSELDRIFIRWGLSGWNNVTTWATDDQPTYVATADLNNDDLDDFATGNKAAGFDTVTVRLRRAGGGFEAPTHYPVHNEFIGDVAFNDCDNDGDLDMFYPAVFADPIEWEAFVYLRLNDGNGAFSAAGSIDMDGATYGLSIGSIVFGDFNEDGWDDIVATRSDDSLVLVTGGMNCSFDPPIISGQIYNPHSLETADMNGDGHLDLVVSYAGQEVISIYLGQGDGNMTGPYEPELMVDFTVRDIGIGDFNNDGLMDIVYAEESGVWLLLARDNNAPPWEWPWPELNGIFFAPAGQAQIEIVLEDVIITNVGTSGNDGADVLLDSARSWFADLDIEGFLGSKLSFDAVANEVNTGAVQLVSAPSGMELWQAFNSTNYMIEYWLDGVLQLALTLPTSGQTPAAVIHWDQDWCMMDGPTTGPPESCLMTLQTYVEGGSNGFLGDSLLWYDGFVIDDSDVTAADGNLVTADRIRIAEIPDGQGGLVANGFSRVEIRGAVIETVTANEIVVVSAEPTPSTEGGWQEDFDSYPTGASLHGLGGWKGLLSDPFFTAFTSNSQSRSAPNSVDIIGSSDIVHEYTNNSGQWSYRYWQYIPAGLQGTSYYIMLNQYDDSGAPINYSTRVKFEGSTGLLVDEGSGASMAYIPDQWVESCLEVDLDIDTQDFYYNGALFYSGSWSSHIGGGGITAVGAVELFANGASSIHYDDMSLTQGGCVNSTFIPVMLR